MKTHSESGFSIIELLLVVVAFSLIGFAGHYVYQTNKAVDTVNSNSKADQTTASTTDTKATITTAATTAVASATVAPIATPEVKTSSDLTTASTTIDQTDPTTSNSSDVAELDAELASF